MEPCPRVQPHSIATELHIGLYNREDGVKITKSRDKTHVDDDEALFLDIVARADTARAHKVLRKTPQLIALSRSKLSGDSALHIAAGCGFSTMLELLLKYHPPHINGYIKNNKGLTPLHLAVMNGEKECCKLLCKSGYLDILAENLSRKYTSWPATQLQSWSSVESIRVAAKTIRAVRRRQKQREVIAETREALFWDDAMNGKTVKVLDALVGGFDPNIVRSSKPLIYAISEKGDARMASVILQFGGPNMSYVIMERDNSTPLHAACRAGHDEVVNILLSNLRKHTDEVHEVIDARDIVGNECEKSGRSALLSSAAGLHVNCIATLIKNGAAASICDSVGNNALHLATIAYANLAHENTAEVEGAAQKVSELIDVFCLPGHLDLRSTNKFGATPLHCAASSGSTLICKKILDSSWALLLEYEDNNDCFRRHVLDVKDVRGLSPLHLSCSRGHLQAAELLLKAGFDPSSLSLSLVTPIQCALKYLEDKQNSNASAEKWLSAFKQCKGIQNTSQVAHEWVCGPN